MPIFKTGDPSTITIYRPISKITTFSKVFVKIVYNDVFNFLYENNKLNENQSGVQANHSTQKANITFVYPIIKAIGKEDIVIAIFWISKSV